ncbi:MAG: putative peptidoglycan glycosyltransferase FtsW [Elusimicrobiales bacterium]
MILSQRLRRQIAALNPADSPYKVDKGLFFTALLLTMLGVIFMYSSSAFLADYYKRDQFYFFKRQIVFVSAGLALMLFLARYYESLRARVNAEHLLYAAWAALAAVFLFKPIANVHRWIPLGPVQIQPSEFAKITLIIYIADYLDKARSRVQKTGLALGRPFVMTAVTLLLIGAGRDLGTPILLLAVVFLMFYAAGARFGSIAKWGLLSVPVIIYAVVSNPYRLTRLMTFMSPQKQASEAGYQLSQSFLAVGSGGWFGAGLGASKMKLMYLPAPHTDFIFAIMSEELGFLRMIPLIGLFGYLLARGIRTAKHADTFSGSMTALGLILMIVIQAFFNMAMSLGLTPTKGVPLPFFSYGGSAALSTLAMTGILLCISMRRPAGAR